MDIRIFESVLLSGSLNANNHQAVQFGCGNKAGSSSKELLGMVKGKENGLFHFGKGLMGRDSEDTIPKELVELSIQRKKPPDNTSIIQASDTVDVKEVMEVIVDGLGKNPVNFDSFVNMALEERKVEGMGSPSSSVNC